MPYSGPPAPDVDVPAAVAALAGGRSLMPVWQNELGGLTFRMGEAGDHDRLFVKWTSPGSGVDLRDEAVRLEWAGRFASVPRVRELGGGAEGSWLVTDEIPGESAVSPRWLRDPGTAIRALGEGLRALHEQLPVDDCPFSWSVDRRIDRRRRTGREVPAALAQAPPIDRLVVCHGDPCAPNTLLGEDGSWVGHVDLGALGVADRWADLAVALWNLGYNYGPGWEDTFLDAYGIAADPERADYYRRLWEAT